MSMLLDKQVSNWVAQQFSLSFVTSELVFQCEWQNKAVKNLKVQQDSEHELQIKCFHIHLERVLNNRLD